MSVQPILTVVTSKPYVPIIKDPTPVLVKLDIQETEKHVLVSRTHKNYSCPQLNYQNVASS